MQKPTIKMKWDVKARFLARPNRFLALVEIEGTGDAVEAHVQDPGRLREILIPGTEVLLKDMGGGSRKTRWSLIAGWVDGIWVLINSSFHRTISEAILSDGEKNPFGPAVLLRPEVKVGNSRLDWLMIDEMGQELFIEVKGCSLTRDGRAIFPDAPTDRGRRHLGELVQLRRDGKRAGLLFLVFGPPAVCLMANEETDPEFALLFKQALKEGVEVRAVRFSLKGDMLFNMGEVPVCGTGSS